MPRNSLNEVESNFVGLDNSMIIKLCKNTKIFLNDCQHLEKIFNGTEERNK